VHLLVFIATAVLMVGGLVLIGEAARSRPDHPACRACGYDLTGLEWPGRRCPECGIALTASTIAQARQRWVSAGMLALGITMVAAAPILCGIGSLVLESLFGPP
jgi:hypothetical protein